MTENEKLLLDVLDIMEGSPFRYWISQGTLLGLVRERRILPWDHDIDISVWAHEVTKNEILEIFEPHGFELEYVPGDLDCLHFKGREKSVDIGFYTISDSVAQIKWVLPGRSFLKKACQFVVSILDENFRKKDIKGKGIVVKKALYNSIQVFLRVAPNLFKRLQIYVVKKYSNYCFEYLGYSYPVSLLQQQGTLTIFGREIPVPKDYEKVLELTYGKNWRVPKKHYVWYEEADNLL